ncbi:MAG TPA: DUF4349 domain-containing protein [Gemmatimonadaceae bacterium]
MKSTSFLLILAAAIACDRETSSPTAQDGVSAQRLEKRGAMLQSKVAMPAPPPAAVSLSGNVAGVVETDMATSAAAEGQASSPREFVNAANPSASTTMLIRTGQAFIEVDKIDPAILKIRQLVVQVGGYVTNSSISGGRDQIRQASIEIKIPNAKYDQAVGSLSSIGKVETVSSNAQDVGEEFVDVSARVANARRLEERLIDLLAKRTGKLDEVLRVERELARVREEIERYEGRLRYLTARVEMSTLTINAHEPAPIIDPGKSPIAEAFRRAWQNFVGLIAALIASLGVLIPIGLIGVGGWIGYRRWARLHRPLTA